MSKGSFEHGNKPMRLYEKLFEDILAGKLAPGDKIPSQIELAKVFGLSRPTVAKGIQLLEKKGLVRRKPGSGTFVCRLASVTEQKIGLLMPRLSINPSDYGHFVSLNSMIVSGISQRAHADDYILLLNDLPIGGEDQVIRQSEQICQQLIDLQTKGVFFMPFELSPENSELNVRIAERFWSAGIAVTLLDRDVYSDGRRSDFDLISVDNRQAVFEMTSHLINLGCKKIDFVSARFDVTSVTRRLQGYREALCEHGLPSDSDRIHRLPFLPFFEQDKKIEKKAVCDYLSHLETDALVCVNDRIASTIMKYAFEMGLKIPDNFRVVGFDDEPFGAYLPVPLTTMRQPAIALGAEAMRVLVSRRQEMDMPAREVMLKADLVVRRSCGAELADSKVSI